jgi:UDP-N-acetylmuramoylalanine--D-glutamate ligase
MPTDLADKRVLVMGLGRFGGGVGVTRFLVRRGARVLVNDAGSPDKLRQSIDKLAGLPVDFRFGEHLPGDFTSADLIVVNPAIDPHKHECLIAARDAGVELTSEVRLLVERLPNPRRIIGVTGTAGKSTVVAMIGHMLQVQSAKSEVRSAKCEVRSDQHETAGATSHFELRTSHFPRTWVGGNIGGSLLESIDEIGGDDWVVLELSSFMLEMLGEAKWSPHTAVATNVSPNHIDRHGTFGAYIAAKQAILDHQPADGRAVLGSGAAVHLTPRVEDVTIINDAQALEELAALKLPGRHNLFNAHLALAACEHAAPRGACIAALATFAGLPHRCQLVAEAGGVRFYNDSKATTPEATYLAVSGFAPGRVHLIVGGYDKQIDLAPLAAFASQHCKALYTIGQTGDAVADIADAGDAEVVRAGTLDEAVRQAVSRTAAGDVVLLSPACASYGMFDNFERRGEAFVELVMKLTRGG